MTRRRATTPCLLEGLGFVGEYLGARETSKQRLAEGGAIRQNKRGDSDCGNRGGLSG